MRLFISNGVIGKIFSVAMVIFALFSGLPFFNKLMLIFISMYISRAAKAEYRMVCAQQMQGGWSTQEQRVDDIHVSPPPYGRSTSSFYEKMKNQTVDAYNGLFKKR